ncbi:class I SAM-dependent methyltransferase [Candidatus Sororendozoicomonas aggregata]|uniref:class I SAM-dependent methyltransferase n=1 Tax=Candidatus Sororendozoicomonas aggregata TaxID=3073239 RepID=UPI002ED4079B
MNNKYTDTFQQRGHPYDLAMQLFPHSRDQEFKGLFDLLNTRHVKNVLDLPSGGGYLSQHLPDHCRFYSADPSQPFHTSDTIKPVDLENLDLPAESFDLVISLAALHHIDNKEGFLASVAQSLTANGYACFADVAAGSGISHFLDDFAGLRNGTGHRGVYLQVDTPFPGSAGITDLHLLEQAVKPCGWLFNNEQDMVYFCRLLFGLNAVDDQDIYNALNTYVGFKTTNAGVELKWELLYITMQRH